MEKLIQNVHSRGLHLLFKNAIVYSPEIKMTDDYNLDFICKEGVGL